jgi:hypothetical protein
MNTKLERMAVRMWGTTTPTIAQVEKSYGKLCKRDEYDIKQGIYRYTHPVNQTLLNSASFISHMTKLRICMRITRVLSEKFLRENGRDVDLATIQFWGPFDNLLEWILWMSAYTTIF